ncbi:hypothetical protein T310_7220 [Rasamsonia emersonii CBS 393.64]|uniref:Uncharacterized protein n=1 Tax=Rasamsonia emersonii (strain ATCC 16479 / CBS 393.64 / IMI 116815) TaxID=1408163 RepID=A0A0F4YMI0_RASE3|nr:hypothetical protein T310_7220 [Rasamsonia emersonii CBS 393.64]KKA18828.1 hypothetical protein T310_7220 [Rasamsonia emersonii CBS 393.64]
MSSSSYMADLIQLMDPPDPNTNYPTEADLTQGPLLLRERAWKHLLLGKKLVPKGEEVKPEMKDTHVSMSILPEKSRVVGVGLVELMDFDEESLLCANDEADVVVSTD